ncbi:MAG: hypothetical protein IJS89_04710 [Bacteroidaceae bacterium]|nr:hypothetical protein [Bacteroidaceae bacterium]
MTPLLAILLSLFTPAVPDSITGSWQRVLVTTDVGTGTEETQTVVRTFKPGHDLTETVIYEQRVLWDDDEAVVLRFRSSVSGQWVANGRDLLLRYLHRTLRVDYEGATFPDRAAEVQGSLRHAFEKKNKSYLRNYVSTMRNVLRNYFRRNSGAAMRDLHFQGPHQFTATLGQETIAFTRCEE